MEIFKLKIPSYRIGLSDDWVGQYTFCWKIFQICGRAGIFVNIWLGYGGYFDAFFKHAGDRLETAQPTSIIMYPSDKMTILSNFVQFCLMLPALDWDCTEQSLEDHNIPPLSSLLTPLFLEKAGTNSSHKNSHYFCPTIMVLWSPYVMTVFNKFDVFYILKGESPLTVVAEILSWPGLRFYLSFHDSDEVHSWLHKIFRSHINTNYCQLN